MHVEALLYTQLDPLPCHAATAPEQLEQWLALQMSQHTRRILSHGGDKPRHHFVSSTSLANSLNRNRMNWSRWSRACQQHHGIQPTAFLNAYECAGWGYALRLARHDIRLVARLLGDGCRLLGDDGDGRGQVGSLLNLVVARDERLARALQHVEKDEPGAEHHCARRAEVRRLAVRRRVALLARPRLDDVQRADELRAVGYVHERREHERAVRHGRDSNC